MEVNPYSIEIRYMLDFMSFMLNTKQPRSVRVYSTSVEMVKAAVRRIAVDGQRLLVDTPEIGAAVRASLGVEVEVAGAEPAEAAFLPFSLKGFSVPREHTLVAAVRNALSYKSLLYPGRVRTTAMGTLARVRRQYHIEQIVGMYPPRFVTLLALAHLIGRWSTSAYFRFNDQAMQYLYDFGPTWRLSYVVIFAGYR